MILTPPRQSREIKIGSLTLGGHAPIRVQSMTSTDTRDVAAALAQIERLVKAGCEIVRLAVPDGKAVEAFGAIRAETQTPLIADIHFDYRLALAALKCGADGVRVNPGNIGGEPKLLRVAEEASR
ncbi:MAG: flavodoxin-dependent (E)-4-hydroxy-3-methylbut-2-enyl-diphosphate synthase, partial [Deltaproteobacteria bacterium]|nr:flavodoxin-dependent (E)-4-hydroxy-3-methylbut-2-enyl-diphosphate synthase [Deltaproteobacteria bacterium]